MMVAFWYGVVAFSLSTYVVLDGRNFGAGILHWIVARNTLERRQIIAAIGPLWLWHEVWLVAFGGVLFLAFPRLLAFAFPGYYLALFLILWCSVLRGISIEVGGHIDDPLWQAFWDAVFFGSSVLLALLFGAGLGNVMRGVPLRADGVFHMPFFTNFRPTGEVGLLDVYTLPVAVFCALVLTAHGATYLAHRTEGAVHDRSAQSARVLWAASVPCFVAISFLTWRVRPELIQGLAHRPLAWIGALACLASAGNLGAGLVRGEDRRALVGSTFLIQGVLATGAIALYPVVFFSTLDSSAAMTAQAVAAPQAGLVAATLWWPLASALAFAYFLFVLRYYSGKVSVARDNQGLY